MTTEIAPMPSSVCRGSPKKKRRRGAYFRGEEKGKKEKGGKEKEGGGGDACRSRSGANIPRSTARRSARKKKAGVRDGRGKGKEEMQTASSRMARGKTTGVMALAAADREGERPRVVSKKKEGEGGEGRVMSSVTTNGRGVAPRPGNWRSEEAWIIGPREKKKERNKKRGKKSAGLLADGKRVWYDHRASAGGKGSIGPPNGDFYQEEGKRKRKKKREDLSYA